MTKIECVVCFASAAMGEHLHRVNGRWYCGEHMLVGMFHEIHPCRPHPVTHSHLPTKPLPSAESQDDGIT